MDNNAKRIQRAIRWYAVSALILTGFVITLVTLIPLQARLFDMQKQHLVYSRDVAVVVVDSCVQRLKEIAKQISIRINGRHVMTDYDDGKISNSEARNSIRKILQNSLSAHPDLISISRFDKNNHLIATAGKSILSVDVIRKLLATNTTIGGPYTKNNQNYLVLMTPVKNAEEQKLGFDVLTFKINQLAILLHQKMHHSLGKIFAFYVQNNHVSWFFQDQHDQLMDNVITNDAILDDLLIKSVERNKSGMLTERFQKEGIVIAYATVPNLPWGIVVYADKLDLYHSVQHVILILLMVAVFILMLFAIGLTAILKPLSGKLLLYSEELESLVEKSQMDLRLANEKLYHMATIDSLTNIYTRRAFCQRFEEEISRCKRYQKYCVLFFIDLDNFKLINDTLGHDAGDYLLKEFSAHLIRSIRKEDVAARLGGDEFALLFPEKPDQIPVSEMVKRITSCAEAPIRYRDQLLSFGMSIGISVYPTDGETVDALFKVADTRMYEDKVLHKK